MTKMQFFLKKILDMKKKVSYLARNRLFTEKNYVLFIKPTASR